MVSRAQSDASHRIFPGGFRVQETWGRGLLVRLCSFLSPPSPGPPHLQHLPANEPRKSLGLQARASHWLSKFSTAAFDLSLSLSFILTTLKLAQKAMCYYCISISLLCFYWPLPHSLPCPTCSPSPLLSLVPFPSCHLYSISLFIPTPLRTPFPLSWSTWFI